jgi:hypothetical protein
MPNGADWNRIEGWAGTEPTEILELPGACALSVVYIFRNSPIPCARELQCTS